MGGQLCGFVIQMGGKGEGEVGRGVLSCLGLSSDYSHAIINASFLFFYDQGQSKDSDYRNGLSRDLTCFLQPTYAKFLSKLFLKTHLDDEIKIK